MNKKEFIERLREAVDKFVANDLEYDDTAQVEIDLPAGRIEVTPEYNEEFGGDSIDVMELVAMTPDGKWIVDEDAIGGLADEYFDE